ncbi:transcription factor HES-1-like [Euwallacea fornicatus]|uniref:transcription factor HES-1-like n=1 Tax=Euwallacea fornicatus TaxID=995702 RepID=UPI0033903D32
MKSDATKKPVSESRRIRKPLMEKMRRARINDSLETLKQMLMRSRPTLREGKNRTAKLEKADILEMTVQHLQFLHSKMTKLQEIDPAKEGGDVRGLTSPGCSDGANDRRVTIYPTTLPSGDIVFVVPSPKGAREGSKENKGHDPNVWRPW